MKAKAPVSQLNIKPVFPKLHLKDFSFMKLKVGQIIRNCKIEAEATGNFPPTAVVFAENALCYEFDISAERVRRSVENLQKILPKDMYVCFAVLEESKDGIRNAGYLLNFEQYKISAKRSYTDYEQYFLEHMFAGSEYAEQKVKAKIDELVDAGLRMEYKRKKFARISSKNLIFELRVCGDAIIKPLLDEPEVTTLIPAFNIRPKVANKLASKRSSVIINDGGGCTFKEEFAKNILIEKTFDAFKFIEK